MQNRTDNSKQSPSLHFQARPERKLIRPTGSKRYVDFHIWVEALPVETEQQRAPLRLGIVLDRSGSMEGAKLQTAKQATLAVIDRLTPRDSVSISIFDNQIDVIQPLAPVTPEFKRQVHRVVQGIQARASTALHEGWLTGCNTLVAHESAQETALKRCFLLTDGIANVGVTDPEQIASEAAGVRERAGISTSTFGIGNDYNELLLGPMAVAGGGQFHHLRSADEITRTFVGELGGLLAVAVRQVRLEIEVDEKVSVDLISPYWDSTATGSDRRRVIAIGDLQGNEERHVVVRFGFPAQEGQEQRLLRSRVLWQADGREQSTDWQELGFLYASNNACDDEPHDAEVMHQVSLHEIDRGRREAVRYTNLGNHKKARASLAAVTDLVRPYAKSPELKQELDALEEVQNQIAAAPMAPAMAKEMYYQQQARSRSQKDYRQSGVNQHEKDDQKKPKKS